MILAGMAAFVAEFTNGASLGVGSLIRVWSEGPVLARNLFVSLPIDT